MTLCAHCEDISGSKKYATLHCARAIQQQTNKRTKPSKEYMQTMEIIELKKMREMKAKSTFSILKQIAIAILFHRFHQCALEHKNVAYGVETKN